MVDDLNALPAVVGFRFSRMGERLSRYLRFNVVGIGGFVVQLSALALLVHVAGMWYVMASALAVEAAVLTALAKVPADRFGSAAEFAAALTAQGPPPRPAHASARPSRAALAAVALGALVVGAGIGALVAGRRGPAKPSFGAAFKVTYEPSMEVHPALSPDGRFLAYAGGQPMHTRLYVRQVSGGRPTLLTSDSTAIEVSPSWSPDGTRILYANQRGLFSVSASGVADSSTCSSVGTSVGGFSRFSSQIRIVSSAANAAFSSSETAAWICCAIFKASPHWLVRASASPNV